MESKVWLNYCLVKKGAYEDYPFGPGIIVLKVCGRMFALFGRREGRVNLSLKCEPYLASLVRQQYQDVIPGYHLNKRHWNTVRLPGDVPEDEIRHLIDHSYDLVVKALTRKAREELAQRRD